MRHSPFLITRTTRLRSSFLLLACLLALFVTACGSSSPNSASGKVNLTFGWWSNGAVSDNLLKAWIKSFESTHPNITITPGVFVPTMLKDLSYYQPATVSANAQLATTMNQILTDMDTGKITPVQAAAQMDQQGNALLSSGS